jgi:hypothetical protein
MIDRQTGYFLFNPAACKIASGFLMQVSFDMQQDENPLVGL